MHSFIQVKLKLVVKLVIMGIHSCGKKEQNVADHIVFTYFSTQALIP